MSIPSPYPPASGIGKFREGAKLCLRLILRGCTTRPFFHVVIQEKGFDKDDPVVEQLGTYDPYPNRYNEKLCALNFERIEYWLKKDILITDPASRLLGLAGYFPIHPQTVRKAWTRRKIIMDAIEKHNITAAKVNEASTKTAPS